MELWVETLSFLKNPKRLKPLREYGDKTFRNFWGEKTIETDTPRGRTTKDRPESTIKIIIEKPQRCGNMGGIAQFFNNSSATSAAPGQNVSPAKILAGSWRSHECAIKNNKKVTKSVEIWVEGWFLLDKSTKKIRTKKISQKAWKYG